MFCYYETVAIVLKCLFLYFSFIVYVCVCIQYNVFSVNLIKSGLWPTPILNEKRATLVPTSITSVKRAGRWVTMSGSAR